MNLEEFLLENNQILPNYNEMNLIDLVRTLYNRYGVNFKENKNMIELEQLIPKNKHTLFILIDGMGTNLVHSLPDDSILKRNLKKEILTVAPSTTGCVLTSVATGEFPIHHGIIGWYSHDKNNNIDYYPLLFCDRKNFKDLKEYNISPHDIYKLESVFNKLKIPTNVLYPEAICNSTYSNYVAVHSIRKPYTNNQDIYQLVKQIITNYENSFTYLYIPTIDNLEHDFGVMSKEVLEEIKKIETLLEKLKHEKSLSIVITADHGQINIQKDVIMDFNRYHEYFYGLPGIDFGMATYYVKEEKRQEFEEKFQNDFKDQMYLFKTEEFLRKNIFGFKEKNQRNLLKNSLGEYISICKNGYCFINDSNTEEYIGKTLGNHSGLSKEEMMIPLIIL